MKRRNDYHWIVIYHNRAGALVSSAYRTYSEALEHQGRLGRMGEMSARVSRVYGHLPTRGAPEQEKGQ